MKNTTVKIGNLLNSFPTDREERSRYLENAKQYSTECGCSLGAKFLATSFGVFMIYVFLSNDFGIASLVKYILLGTVFVFTSGIAGKLIGIGVARIKLVLLYRDLVGKSRAINHHILGE